MAPVATPGASDATFRTCAGAPTLMCPPAPTTVPTVGALPDALFAASASATDSDGAITEGITCDPESFAAIPDGMLPAIGDPDAVVEVTCSLAGAPDCTFDATVAPGAPPCCPCRARACSSCSCTL